MSRQESGHERQNGRMEEGVSELASSRGVADLGPVELSEPGADDLGDGDAAAAASAALAGAVGELSLEIVEGGVDGSGTRVRGGRALRRVRRRRRRRAAARRSRRSIGATRWWRTATTMAMSIDVLEGHPDLEEVRGGGEGEGGLQRHGVRARSKPTQASRKQNRPICIQTFMWRESA